MWGKVAELLIRYLIVPLASKLIAEFMDYIKERQEEAKRNEAIEKGIGKIVDATTPEEQKDALKNIVKGVRERRAAK